MISTEADVASEDEAVVQPLGHVWVPAAVVQHQCALGHQSVLHLHLPELVLQPLVPARAVLDGGVHGGEPGEGVDAVQGAAECLNIPRRAVQCGHIRAGELGNDL